MGAQLVGCVYFPYSCRANLQLPDALFTSFQSTSLPKSKYRYFDENRRFDDGGSPDDKPPALIDVIGDLR
jgi:hypothetical protein